MAIVQDKSFGKTSMGTLSRRISATPGLLPLVTAPILALRSRVSVCLEAVVIVMGENWGDGLCATDPSRRMRIAGTKWTIVIDIAQGTVSSNH